jgi:hypothetical protein
LSSPIYRIQRHDLGSHFITGTGDSGDFEHRLKPDIRFCFNAGSLNGSLT